MSTIENMSEMSREEFLDTVEEYLTAHAITYEELPAISGLSDKFCESLKDGSVRYKRNGELTRNVQFLIQFMTEEVDLPVDIVDDEVGKKKESLLKEAEEIRRETFYKYCNKCRKRVRVKMNNMPVEHCKRCVLDAKLKEC